MKPCRRLPDPESGVFVVPRLSAAALRRGTVARTHRLAPGFTLVELLVVLVVLASLAGIAVQAAGAATHEAALAATRAQLATVREAIVGVGSATPSYGTDCGGTPRTLADLLRLTPGQTCFVPYPPGQVPVVPFDPALRRGWRGPYVLMPTARYTIDVVSSFFAVYGADGDPAVLDGWGRAIVLQVPDLDGDPTTLPTADELRHARLVSAGQDGILETRRDLLLPPALPGDDDVVIFLRVADLR